MVRKVPRREFLKRFGWIAIAPFWLKAKVAEALPYNMFGFKNGGAGSTTPMRVTQLAGRIAIVGGPGSLRASQLTARVAFKGGPGTLRTSQLAARVAAIGGSGVVRTSQVSVRVLVKP